MTLRMIELNLYWRRFCFCLDYSHQWIGLREHIYSQGPELAFIIIG